VPIQSFIELATTLNLDDAQKRRLRQTYQEIRRSSEPRLREQAMLRERVAGELRKPQPDGGEVEKMLDQLAMGRAAIQKDIYRRTSQFAATLTPEQQEKFRQFVLARTLGQPGAAAPRPRREGTGPNLREDRPARQQ